MQHHPAPPPPPPPRSLPHVSPQPPPWLNNNLAHRAPFDLLSLRKTKKKLVPLKTSSPASKLYFINGFHFPPLMKRRTSNECSERTFFPPSFLMSQTSAVCIRTCKQIFHQSASPLDFNKHGFSHHLY